MKKTCAAVLGVLMLGATCSFAQRLDNNNQIYYPKPLPSLQRKPAPLANELYPGQNAYRQEMIQRKVEKEKAKVRWAEMTEEDRRDLYDLFKSFLNNDKKLIERYKWTLGSDWGAQYFLEIRIEDRSQPRPGGIGSKLIFYRPYSEVGVVVLSKHLPNGHQEVEVHDMDGKRLFKAKGDLIISGYGSRRNMYHLTDMDWTYD